MTTYVRSGVAARTLGVTTATLYSYVSRGRVTRTIGADGRTSLFDLDQIEALRDTSRRPAPAPPTIDVRISTSVTQLNEDGPRYRDISVEALVDTPFEHVAELLWSGSLPTTPPRWQVPADTIAAMQAVAGVDRSTNATLALLRAATVLDASADATDSARTLYAAIPQMLGASGRRAASEPYARTLTRLWRKRPAEELVSAVNTALVLLADHELATSTLAARVATSVRAPYPSSIAAALATVDGDLHGSASHHVHRLLLDVHRRGPEEVLHRHRSDRQRVPGFGHTIYRQRDPRFALLLDRVRALPDHDGRRSTVERLLATAGALVAQPPNIDLALGALTFVADLPERTPIFPIARIAGWTAHYLEELDERPVRFRGLAH